MQPLHLTHIDIYLYKITAPYCIEFSQVVSSRVSKYALRLIPESHNFSHFEITVSCNLPYFCRLCCNHMSELALKQCANFIGMNCGRPMQYTQVQVKLDIVLQRSKHLLKCSLYFHIVDRFGKALFSLASDFAKPAQSLFHSWFFPKVLPFSGFHYCTRKYGIIIMASVALLNSGV